jgi:hypothetical protein
MGSESSMEQQYVTLLLDWLSSIRQRFRLNADWSAALAKLEKRLKDRPQAVTAFEVGRVFQPLEKRRAVTQHTPGADRALHFLIETGRIGPMEKASDELHDWFRKHYMWASASTSINVSELNTHTSDEVFRQYFSAG